jgi:hypothetical protein
MVVNVTTDLPHAGNRARHVVNRGKPVDQCAGIRFVLVVEFQKCINLCNVQASKTGQIWRVFNEHTIVARWTISPWGDGMYPFTKHPSNAWFIARCEIRRSGWWVDVDLACILRVCSGIGYVAICIGFCCRVLMMEELRNKLRHLWDTKPSSYGPNFPRNSTNFSKYKLLNT